MTSQKIDELLTKFKDVFAGREEDIKAHLLKYHQKDFEGRQIKDLVKIDATEMIKTTGFRKNIMNQPF